MKTVTEILIVEDEPVISLDLKKKLERSGFTVAGCALNGDMAIKMARELQPELILMDIGLPGRIDGIEAAEAIRKIYSVPIIYLTSYSDDDTVQRAIQTNPYGYIIKPASREQLIITIKLVYNKFLSHIRRLESEKRYQSIAENLPLMICSIDPRTSAIILINRSFADYLGIDQDYTESNNFFSAISWKHNTNIQSIFNHLSRDNPSHVFEQFINNGSGSTWLRCTCHALYDDYGNLFEYQYFQEDITPSRQRELLIKNANEELKIRVQALSCSSGISSMAESRFDLPDEILQEIVYIIHRSFEFPGDTCVQIIYKGQIFSYGSFDNPDQIISEPVRVKGDKPGRLCIYFSSQFIKQTPAHFLDEYRRFFRSIAARTGEIIERIESRIELKKLEREMISITERERGNIGHEIHDSLGQLLTGISFLINTASRKIQAEGLEELEEIREIKELVRESVAKCRQLSRGLSALSIENRGLHLVLDQYANDVRELYNINCNVNLSEDITINDDFTVTQLYRIAQEAVNNAVKHSNADCISIEMIKTPEHILFSVKDNGRGLTLTEKDQGLGMSIMKYRARLIQGSFISENCPDGGFMVAVRFSPDQGFI